MSKFIAEHRGRLSHCSATVNHCWACLPGLKQPGYPHNNDWFLSRYQGSIFDAMANYVITQLDALEAVRCPCGLARRALGDESRDAFSLHLVKIQQDARAHYHQRLTEVYLVLEGEGHMELDNRLHPVKPYTAVLIRPGCRHRALGRLMIANFVWPAFDPHDEWF